MAEIRDYSTAPDPQTADRWPEGMAMSAVNDTGRVDEGIIARWYQDTRGDLLSTGSANAYVLATNRTFTAGYDGLVLVFQANFTNTGAATLEVSGGIAATAIVSNDGGALGGGEIRQDSKITVIHNGTSWVLISPDTALIPSDRTTSRSRETQATLAQSIHDITDPDYGADPTGAVDSTAAIQAAITAAGLDGTVFAPPGIYLLNAVIDLAGFTGEFRGAGLDTTTFRMTVDDTPIFNLDTSGSQGLNFGSMRLEYSSPQPATNTSAKCINVTGDLFMSKLSEIVLVDGAYGLYAASGNFSSNLLENFRFRNCSLKYIVIDTTAGNTGNHFSNIYLSGNRADVLGSTCDTAIDITLMSDSVWNQVNVEWMAISNRAFVLNRCNGVTFNGVHIEGTTLTVNLKSLFQINGTTAKINGLRLNNVNFSGGDTNPVTTGTVANSAIVQMETEDATSEKASLELFGTNANCTAAVTNNRVLISNNPLDLDGIDDTQMIVPVWRDYDGIFEDANGEPFVNLVNLPTTPYMPVLRQWNNVYYMPYARGSDPGAGGPAAIVLWPESVDTNACYDPATGKFTAPVTGSFHLEFTIAASAIVEIRFENAAGSEQTSLRMAFDSGGTYVSGSAVFQRKLGEKVYVYSNPAWTSDVKTWMQCRMLR